MEGGGGRAEGGRAEGGRTEGGRAEGVREVGLGLRVEEGLQLRIGGVDGGVHGAKALDVLVRGDVEDRAAAEGLSPGRS